MKKLYLFLFLSIINPLQTYSMQLNRGFLFSIEGFDGAGKTTLIKNLADKFQQANLNVITTREPGATDLGKTLRNILMNKTVETCTLAEFFLFAADRAQHFQTLVIPHLQQNYIVISDRMADSSLIYQGYVKGLDLAMIQQVNQIAMQSHKPDLVIYLRIEAADAVARINQRDEKSVPFEQDLLDKKQFFVDSFDELFANRQDVIVVDAMLSEQQVADQVFDALIKYITSQS